MDTGEYLTTQNLMILGTVLVAAIIALAMFLRKKSNRDAASLAFSGSDSPAANRATAAQDSGIDGGKTRS